MRNNSDAAPETPEGVPGAFAEPSSLTDAALLEGVLENAAVRRRIDRESALLIDEVQRRSAKERGEESLAAKYGFSSGIGLLEDLTGELPATLLARARVGDAIREPLDWYEQNLPPRFPHLAEAMADGAIGAEQAVAIVTELDAARRAGDTVMLDKAERNLVHQAAGGDWSPANPDDPANEDTWVHPDAAPMPARLVKKFATEWKVRIDTDGVEPRADLQMRRRSYTTRRNADGTYTITIVLPPQQFADADAFMKARMSRRTSKTGGRGTGGTGDGGSVRGTGVDAQSGSEVPADTGGATDIDTSNNTNADADTDAPESRFMVVGDIVDTRTPAQKRADAFMDFIHEAAASKDAPLIGGHNPTGLVVIPISETRKPGGVAFVQGADPPVPARRAIEQIACTGTIQYLLVDDVGLPLKLGREQRLFSAAQRRALAARDKTCFVDGCDAPASAAQVHHVQPFSQGGVTDIANAVLACEFHHGQIHSGHLRVVLRNNSPPAATRLKNSRRP